MGKVSGYKAGRHGKVVSVRSYYRGGGVKSRVKTPAAKPSIGGSIKFYNPKSGPSAAEKQRNAAIMFGSAGKRAKPAKKRKR